MLSGNSYDKHRREFSLFLVAFRQVGQKFTRPQMMVRTYIRAQNGERRVISGRVNSINKGDRGSIV